ncbi:unnamed protein product [Dovyalis caffra]|uniref:MADS-box domain-containing protein n=1 Tax=Dovyalis caffra TaxID=77055 RepID=A0AAV1R846_9ROSI|nr:unnamed protein product [Dovyalis caffra]
MVRKSRGRQKVEMVKMSKESNLQVTFSKRRSGLFKKASELCTLCGAEIAIIVFSPGNKVFSFGHPGVGTVIDRYITRNPPQNSGAMQILEVHRNATVRELNVQLTQVLNQIEMEKRRGEELNQMKKAGQSQCWWQAPIEELKSPQIEQLKVSLEDLKKNVTKQAEKLLIESSAPPQFFASSSGGGIFPYDRKVGGFNPNMVAMVNKKPSMGRQKIKIEKIPKKNHLQVTFSKRRAGLFKKASELCTLCGVDIAIVVFSPAQKAFSFGHPDVDSIMDRFLIRNPPPSSSGTHLLIEAHRNANVREQNMQLTQILNQLEAEKRHSETLNQMRKNSRSQCWWEAPIEELGLHELEQLRDALEELKKKVTKEAGKVLIESTNSLPFSPVNGFGPIGNFETKPEISVSSTIPRVNNFGYGHGLF